MKSKIFLLGILVSSLFTPNVNAEPKAHITITEDEMVHGCLILGQIGYDLVTEQMLTGDIENGLNKIKIEIKKNGKIPQAIFENFEFSLVDLVKTYEKETKLQNVYEKSSQFSVAVYKECYNILISK